MTGFKAFYKGKSIDIYSDTLYHAQLEAQKIFKAKRGFTMITYLKPILDAAKSFYNKAQIITNGSSIKLLSYNTLVAEITKISLSMNEAQAVVYGIYSMTTLRHIKEFLKQSGFEAENKKQIERDYIK